MVRYYFMVCLCIAFLFSDDSVAVAVKIQKQVKQTIARSIDAYVSIGGGAGAIISKDGYIITNNHVVEDHQETWFVKTGKGKTYRAKVVGRDKKGDLCLLKIVPEQNNLPFLKLGNSNLLYHGQRVLAMGNPFLYSTDGSPSVSLGIVSALHCFQDNYGDAIQTDTSLNPGNSGGPLINFQGEIVGICGRIASRFNNRRSSGVGFAITSNQVKNFLPLLKRGAKIHHGYIGIDVREYFNQGVLVKSSPIKVFKPGDIVLKIAGLPIYSLDLFYGKLWTYPANTVVPVTVKRQDQILTLRVTLQKFVQEEK
ncbi:S1C family serine protease [Candidatus Uabimicrobium amorphum]|uniref:Peptidase n=1 Tax=Uabimicrobium amorphum TaxID=2596890 RepID=A0A5S9F2E7_UABAM|nr:trypsin-like peptidase domain-containing protein [Candidatus Uabimicrobium amorphum]BBM82032.1 peptidase [Candidatus Uabimicrobium amorphum]